MYPEPVVSGMYMHGHSFNYKPKISGDRQSSEDTHRSRIKNLGGQLKNNPPLFGEMLQFDGRIFEGRIFFNWKWFEVDFV